MSTVATTQTAAAHTGSRALGAGTGLMTFGAIAFVGYAVIFFIRNFTDSFLELGIGPGEVSVGKDAIEQFSPSLYHYIGHLHIAAIFVAGALLSLKALAEGRS
jgi:hypothetical protein